MQPLREEVDLVVANGGWAKASVGQLYKLDSFFRETQRYNGLGLGEVHLTPHFEPDFSPQDAIE